MSRTYFEQLGAPDNYDLSRGSKPCDVLQNLKQAADIAILNVRSVNSWEGADLLDSSMATCHADKSEGR